MKKVEVMKEYIKAQNKTHLVRELVNSGWSVDVAVEYIYDGLTLTNEEIRAKYYSC